MVLTAACTRTGGPPDSQAIAPEPVAASSPAAGATAPGNPAAEDAETGDAAAEENAPEHGVADATAPTTPPGDAADPDPRIALGLATYRQQYCGICHRLDAAGTGGVFGPTHDGMGATAEERIRDTGYGGAATTAEAYIRESIVDPDAYVVPGYEMTRHRMPAYTGIGDAELDALVRFLLLQKERRP